MTMATPTTSFYWLPLEKPPSPETVPQVCRFCLVPALGMHQLAWTLWPGSEVGRLFNELTGRELVASDGLTEFYCETCMNRLRQATVSKRIFDKVEVFWSEYLSGCSIKTEADDAPFEDAADLCPVEYISSDEEEHKEDVVAIELMPIEKPEIKIECFVCHESVDNL